MLNRANIEAAARERAREESGSAGLDLGMGAVFTAAVYVGTSLFLFVVFWQIPGVSARWTLAGAFAITALFMILGTWLEPASNWNQATYNVAGGGREGHDPSQVAGGIHAGMPLGTLVSDPENIQARTGVFASGCANFLLGGPRQLRRGWAALARVRVLRDSASVGAALVFVEWAGTREPMLETEVLAQVAKRPDLAAGWEFLKEVRLARFRRDGVNRVLELGERTQS